MPPTTIRSAPANSRIDVRLALRPIAAAARQAACCGAWLVALSPGLVQAQPQSTSPNTAVSAAVRMYRIPAGALDTAAASFAATAGISLSFAPDLLAGRRTRGLQGNFTPQDGLNYLLEDTGLEAAPQAGGVYLIRVRPAPPTPPPARAPQADRSEAVLPTINVTADAGGGAFGYQDEGFAAANTRSATRTDTALSDIPQAIQIVTQEVMKSQQAQSVEEAWRNVSAVNMAANGNSDTVMIRGFEAPVLLNGVHSPVVAGIGLLGLAVPMAAVDRVEVLKGADSIIAGGQMEPGGVVNVVTKRPQAERLRELTLEAQNDGRRLVSLDLAGAVSEDGSLSYRTVLSGTYDAHSYDGYDNRRDVYFAPSLGWRHAGTSLVVGMTYQSQRRPNSEQQYATLTADGPGPNRINMPNGNPADGSKNTNTSLFFDLEQRLWNDWAFLGKFEIQQRRTRGSYFASDSFNSDETGAAYAPAGLFGTYNNWSLENSIRGRFKTGALKHTVLGGLSRARDWTSVRGDYEETVPFVRVPDPAHLHLPPANSLLAGERLYPPAYSGGVNTSTNVFLQDQIAWGRWHVLANVGYAQLKNPANNTVTDADGQKLDVTPPQNKPVYNFGLAYRLNDSATVYANTLSSFMPGGTYLNATLDGSERGRISTPPTEGQSTELGLKLNLLDDRLTATGNLFRAAHTNVVHDLHTGGLPPGYGDYVLLPSTLSQGLELDVNGRLARGWNLTTSYSYTKFTYAKPPTSDARLSQIPRHKLTLWTTYDLQAESLRGWGAGAGLTMRSSYKANYYDTDGRRKPQPYRMGSQARFDASIYYKSKAWSATLGIKNLFNRRLFSDFAEGTVNVEPYRSVVLSASYSF
jgi:iron complex outermembrane receptor protein